ncbi:MAG: cytochrome C, partial [Desulfovibrionales bacterium]|nr:cytochrome C [Desulfovibrionales bacterium]
AYNNLPYSGEFDFVDTEYVFPITHMVAPKEQTLHCTECHVKNGRLEHLTGFYMPGRDAVRLLDLGGWGMIGMATLGVFLHGLGRFIGYMGRKE